MTSFFRRLFLGNRRYEELREQTIEHIKQVILALSTHEHRLREMAQQMRDTMALLERDLRALDRYEQQDQS